MKEFDFNGDIIEDYYAKVYEYFGITGGYVAPMLLKRFLNEADGEDVVININSSGGCLIAGTEMYSILRNYGGQITARITGCSASAATVAMMGCSTITAEPAALVCVHNPTTGAHGTADTMRHTAEELDNVKEAIINAYIGKVKLTREEMSDLMDKDMWIDANKALEYGLIDSINNKPLDISSVRNSAQNGTLPSKKMIDEYEASKLNAAKKAKARAKLSLYKA